MPINNEKKYYLEKEGCLNPNASKIKADIFNDENEFFEKTDIVQARYEMLRSVDKDGASINSASGMYGVSRISFYKTRKAFENKGLLGLLPQKKGPKKPSKLTPAVMDFLKSERKTDPKVKSDKLAEKILKEFGCSVHPRTIEKALASSKKKREKSGFDQEK